METSDRKGPEQEAQQQAQGPAEAVERLRSVVNNVVDGIITIDHRGTVTTFNPAAERIFGYPAPESSDLAYPGKSFHDLSFPFRTGQVEACGHLSERFGTIP